MPIDETLEDLFIHTVTTKPHTGRDVDRKPTYGTAVNHSAKIVMKTRHVIDPDGQAVQGRGTVYILPPTTLPTVKDELTMPSGFSPSKPPILDVRPHYDEDGLHHVALVIG